MNVRLKAALLLALLNIIFPKVASAQEATLGYATFGYASYEVTPPGYAYGTRLAETYDVAIALNAPELVGKQITSISVPVCPSDVIYKTDGTDVQVIDSLSFWITRELTLGKVDGKNKNIPDVMVVKAEVPLAEDNYNPVVVVECTLAEPFTIPEGGVFVGYSLNVAAVDESVMASYYPVAIAAITQPGGFYIHSSRTYRKWKELSSDLGVVSMLQVGIEGDIPAHGARISDFVNAYFEASQEGTTQLSISNLGCNPVESIDYTVKVAGQTLTEHLKLSPRLPATYLYATQFDVKIPAVSTPGSYDVEVTIDKVNGQDNGIGLSQCAGLVGIVGELPKHRPLVEEFSGTTCGYCPRGTASMEWMRENHADDFIAVVWHGFDPNNDPMYPATNFPLDAFTSAPQALIDRHIITDPYYGYSDGYGFPALWQSVAEEFTPVAISVEAEWADEAETQIKATSTVNWSYLPSDLDAEYRVEYILVGDDLSGTDPSWRQANYFSGSEAIELMNWWCGAPRYVSNLHYNDVGLLTSGAGGVENSIGQIAVAQPTEHSFVFDTRDILNSKGDPIPFHADKLRVIAVLLKSDGSYGTVLNAAKCEVPVPSAINNPTADGAAIQSERYFDLSGSEISAPTGRNVVLKVTTLADGTKLTIKSLR